MPAVGSPSRQRLSGQTQQRLLDSPANLQPAGLPAATGLDCQPSLAGLPQSVLFFPNTMMNHLPPTFDTATMLRQSERQQCTLGTMQSNSQPPLAIHQRLDDVYERIDRWIYSLVPTQPITKPPRSCACAVCSNAPSPRYQSTVNGLALRFVEMGCNLVAATVLSVAGGATFWFRPREESLHHYMHIAGRDQADHVAKQSKRSRRHWHTLIEQIKHRYT